MAPIIPGDDNLMTVTLYVDGETVSTKVPRNATIQALFEGGYLRGIQVGNVRVNGAPADAGTTLREGDKVQAAPTGGALAS